MKEQIYKPRSKKQMAVAYGVDRRTFMKWIKPFMHLIGEYSGTFTPKQVKTIYDHIGSPNYES